MTIDEEQFQHQYAQGKWTVAELRAQRKWRMVVNGQEAIPRRSRLITQILARRQHYKKHPTPPGTNVIEFESKRHH